MYGKQKERKMIRKLAIASVAAGLTLLAMGACYAGQADPDSPDSLEIEVMTVTANKTEENIQNIPMSITALDQYDISDRSIETTMDVFQRVPNMHLTTTGPMGATDNIASVRGITSFMTGGSVYGFFVDDVFYPSADINLMDVKRIEVLRGPQGTLYGQNTEAGVINIITKEPDNQWAGDIQMTYGNYNSFDTTLSGGGAIVKDKLFLRMAGKFGRSDGFFTNTLNNDDAVNKGDTYDTRMSLLFSPSDRFKADLKINVQKYDTSYAEFSTFDKVMDGNFDISVNTPGYVDKDFVNTALKLVYDFDKMRLTSISTVLNDERKNGMDMDFSGTDSSRMATDFQTRSYSQELRLSSLDTTALKWTVGSYVYNNDEGQILIYDMINYGQAGLQGDTDTTGMALYGQADYTFQKWVVTAGLRYEYQTKDYDYQWKEKGNTIGYTPCSGTTDKDFSALLPKFALTYHVTDNFRPYVSATRGFKSGGFNLGSDPGQAYDSEYTWNYELGFKSELAQNRIQLNAALFYINWEDLQVEQPSYPDFVVENAAEATSKGVEVELTVNPVTGLEIYGSFGYVDATYDEYTYAGINYAGKNIANAPDKTYSIGSTYRFLDHWMINAELNGTGKIYYEADNNKSQSSYEVFDVKAGYESEKFDVYLWAKNLFDESYATRAFEMTGSGWYARSGDPLTFGLTVKYRF